MKVSRRSLLKALAAVPLLNACAAPGTQARAVTLTAGVSRQRLISDAYPDTEVWTYDRTVPGPLLRIKQGGTLQVAVDNRLPSETTVHWHGMRVPNAMDGVPHVTQPPIPPDGRFVYEFQVPDAGTYWYHPHVRSHEQVARGLYGVLIVDEPEPVRVDREAVWVLADWRLSPDAALRDDFENLFDLTHAGRIGNTVTVNGRFTAKTGVFKARSGERLRLRLVNAAVARVFRLNFAEHEPVIIALDGQPIAPHTAPDGIVLGPGMRADLVLDCMRAPGARADVTDDFYPRMAGRLMQIVYDDGPAIRARAMSAAIALPPNRLPDPDLAHAERHEIVFQGGAMGTIRDALYAGERTSLARLVREHHLAWTVNGTAVKGHVHAPLLTLRRGRPYVLGLRNDTAWHHPMHLHGHVFRVVARNAAPTAHREWRDTVLVAPRERVDIAFVADNPGDWMLHCHVLAHQAGGMTAMLRVA
ncbi:MAG: copper oxidase [Burkholderiales bacterium]|jgi:FtsP/CotA-like multicopper oxidase with cupredoxin domain|nr:copper oxidase [Burkholderiales bacterium]